MHTESSRTPRSRRVACLLALAAAFGLFAAGAGTAAASSTPTAQHVVQQLKALGLPISATKTYTAASDTNSLLGRPGQYTSKTNFRDQRLHPSWLSQGFDVQNGGAVEVFATNAAARVRYRYMTAISQALPLFLEYDYLHGRVLLRLSHSLTPAQAGRYAAALKRS